PPPVLRSFPTRRSSDLRSHGPRRGLPGLHHAGARARLPTPPLRLAGIRRVRRYRRPGARRRRGMHRALEPRPGTPPRPAPPRAPHPLRDGGRSRRLALRALARAARLPLATGAVAVLLSGNGVPRAPRRDRPHRGRAPVAPAPVADRHHRPGGGGRHLRQRTAPAARRRTFPPARAGEPILPSGRAGGLPPAAVFSAARDRIADLLWRIRLAGPGRALVRGRAAAARRPSWRGPGESRPLVAERAAVPDFAPRAGTADREPGFRSGMARLGRNAGTARGAPGPRRGRRRARGRL